MRRIYFFISVLLIFSVSILPGCFITPGTGSGEGPDEGIGAIMVQWTFVGEEICPIDVESVAIELRDFDQVMIGDPVIVDCEEGQQQLPELETGTYYVKVLGLDGNEVTWEADQIRLGVFDQQETVVEIDLEPLP